MKDARQQFDYIRRPWRVKGWRFEINWSWQIAASKCISTNPSVYS
jgi:hypothetical protein